MALRSKAEIEPRFPALQPVSSCKGALLPPRGTQYFRQGLEPDGGARNERSRGSERKESSREGDFPDPAGSWWGKGGCSDSYRPRTILECWEQLFGVEVWAECPTTAKHSLNTGRAGEGDETGEDF